MTADEWRPFLHTFSRHILADPELRWEVSAADYEAGYLGREGAGEAELVEVERRLGTVLPPSYREFLRASNGWGVLSHAIMRLWPAANLEWFKTRHQQWIDIWTRPPRDGRPSRAVTDEESFVYGSTQSSLHLRKEYLPSMLEVSEEFDGAIVLLNPEVVSAEGEWEAWFFASWLPGAMRFRSFAELMRYELEDAAKRAATSQRSGGEG